MPTPSSFLHPRWLLPFLVLTLTVPLSAAPPPNNTTSKRVEFNRDIRPILSDHCFLCHGPDKNRRKGKLRLDLRDDALLKKAIVPGDPASSRLVERILTSAPDDLMPPAETHKSLSPPQKSLLQRWIAEGAEYQPHWAYLRPTRPAPPAPGATPVPAGWDHNPVDAFILDNLTQHALKPSPPADRSTLIRRLHLDLTGLPPQPNTVASFLQDKSPDATDRAIDSLLASPHFGERMGSAWLDLVRFADTVGYHGDQNQNVFPYRDYVVRSFNDNKPFDWFTIEQLAGDLLPNPTTEQRVATGFNRLNMMTREGGAQPREYLAKYAADRVRTVGTTWLGSTLGCAECHDHKYDPFTMRDFYSMAAFFADVQQWGVYSDYKYTPNPELKGWSNDHPFPPELEVPSEYLKQRAASLRHTLSDLKRKAVRTVLEQSLARTAARSWQESTRIKLTQNPDGWAPVTLLPPEPPKGTNPPPQQLAFEAADGSIRLTLGLQPAGADGKKEKREEAKLRFRTPPGPLAAIRLQLAPLPGGFNESLGENEPSRGIRLSGLIRRTDGTETNLSFTFANADHSEPRYANGTEVLDVLGAWIPGRAHCDQTQTAVYVLPVGWVLNDQDVLQLTVRSLAPISVRFSITSTAAEDPLKSGADPALLQALDKPPQAWTDAQLLRMGEAYLWNLDHPVLVASRREYRARHRDWLECRDGRSQTLVTIATTPTLTRILPRGNWQNESGDIVQPAPPTFLTPSLAESFSKESPRRSRLDLARWLVSRENPLTARVIMNRLWKQFFGTGLSAGIDDLGTQGEWPAHPQLLDWLAVEFMDSGWDLKHMVRLITTSAAYRQQASLRPELRDLDPQNRWVASQSPRRLEAEFVRDNALAIAGLLNLQLGGPSIRPYQPPGYYENIQFPDRDYIPHQDERQYRRGLYMHWQRTFLHPMLANFDAPSREECTAARNQSNTPQQALTLLNDPTFVEAARVLAVQLLTGHSHGDRSRFEEAWLRTLARPPRPEELSSIRHFLDVQRAHYRKERSEAEGLLKVGLTPTPGNLPATEVAAWTSCCRVLLNLHETITR